MSPELLKSFIHGLLEKLGVEAEIEVQHGHRTVARVTSPDSKRLIGPGGEHLRALNTVAKRLAEAKHGDEAAGFLIDVDGYHEASLERVREHARMLAQRARLFKHDV